MLVKQRFPNFVEVGDEVPVHEINSLKELQSIDFIQRWSADEDFVKLQCSGVGGQPELLMAIMKESWWVIAYGREGSFIDLGLTEWKSPNEGK
jgi:hypothetical protein